MKKILVCTIIWFLGLSTNQAWAQESKYHALYIYNFTKHINWNSREIEIGVLGESEVLADLSSYVQRNPNIKLKTMDIEDALTSCDMLFLPSTETTNFQAVQNKIGSTPVLLITEEESLLSQGAEFAFYNDGGQVKFAINKTELEKSGLTVSSRLYQLGRVMD